jgi:hypothetical protein
VEFFKSENASNIVFGKLGDYLLDMSKMIFAGIILVSIVDASLPRAIVLVSAICAMVLTLLLGVVFISKEDKE